MAIKIGIDATTECRLFEIQQAEIAIKDYQIIVVDAESGYNYSYVGPVKDKKINMLCNNQH